ncbi:MAG TPA: azurin [Candidatus Dormibacteraeota bacterium]|nr:azurin [Candidatus Dormibacteraeota bacterium]
MQSALAAVTLIALALPLAAHADPCKVEISGNDVMQYDKKELAVPATCREITVTLHHVGKQPREAMGHDWVLVKTPNLAAVAQAGIGAGLANNYLVPGDKRVLAHTRVIGGGESTSVTFSASILTRGADYSYLCTFPGHSALMHGKFRFG